MGYLCNPDAKRLGALSTTVQPVGVRQDCVTLGVRRAYRVRHGADADLAADIAQSAVTAAGATEDRVLQGQTPRADGLQSALNNAVNELHRWVDGEGAAGHRRRSDLCGSGISARCADRVPAGEGHDGPGGRLAGRKQRIRTRAVGAVVIRLGQEGSDLAAVDRLRNRIDDNIDGGITKVAVNRVDARSRLVGRLRCRIITGDCDRDRRLGVE